MFGVPNGSWVVNDILGLLSKCTKTRWVSGKSTPMLCMRVSLLVKE